MLPDIDNLAQSYITNIHTYNTNDIMCIRVLYKVNFSHMYQTDINDLLDKITREKNYMIISPSHRYILHLRKLYHIRQLSNIPCEINHCIEFGNRTVKINMSLCEIRQISEDSYKQIRAIVANYKTPLDTIIKID